MGNGITRSQDNVFNYDVNCNKQHKFIIIIKDDYLFNMCHCFQSKVLFLNESLSSKALLAN